jgi:hypothetical protein
MKKLVTLFVLIFVFAGHSPAQSEWYEGLSETNMEFYAQPLANAYGIALNSSGYHSAKVSDVFGFAISFIGVYILVPDDQLTYKPSLPVGYDNSVTSPTIFGGKEGGFYSGPNGYITTLPGTDLSPVPFAMPQVSASFIGTEVLLRFIPEVSLADRKVSLIGLGAKHSISRYFQALPVDIAVQVLYNSFKVTDLIEGTNLAFNAHTSMDMGIFTPYFGLQYESASMDLEYDLEPDPNSGDPDVQAGKNVNLSLDGENDFRATLGGALKFGFLVLNADVSVGNQTIFGGGLSFEF